jgi:hypothetical protein
MVTERRPPRAVMKDFLSLAEQYSYASAEYPEMAKLAEARLKYAENIAPEFMGVKLFPYWKKRMILKRAYSNALKALERDEGNCGNAKELRSISVMESQYRQRLEEL